MKRTPARLTLPGLVFAPAALGYVSEDREIETDPASGEVTEVERERGPEREDD